MGTLILYSFIAVVFFYIGRNYENIRNQVEKRIPEKKSKVRLTQTYTLVLSSVIIDSLFLVLRVSESQEKKE